MDEVGSATISVRTQQADHHTNQTPLGLPTEITESREMLQIFIDSQPDWLFGGTFSLTSAAQQPMETSTGSLVSGPMFDQAIPDPSSNLRKIPCPTVPTRPRPAQDSSRSHSNMMTECATCISQCATSTRLPPSHLVGWLVGFDRPRFASCPPLGLCPPSVLPLTKVPPFHFSPNSSPLRPLL
jgi:hypothetical protein